MNVMNQKFSKRLKFAKKILFLAWIIAVIGSVIFLYYRFSVSSEGNIEVPVWANIPFFTGSILMLIGVLLGSRGVGVPLDVKRFFSLLLGYPCWIPFLVYLANMWVVPMIYYKFIR